MTCICLMFNILVLFLGLVLIFLKTPKVTQTRARALVWVTLGFKKKRGKITQKENFLSNFTPRTFSQDIIRQYKKKFKKINNK